MVKGNDLAKRFSEADRRPEVMALVKKLKSALPGLQKKLEEVNDHWVYEDGVYRFYHQSFKVFYLQETVKSVVKALEDLRPGEPLNKWFLDVVKDGTKEKFDLSFNDEWMKHTRPVVEAFFHAKFFLEMAVQYGRAFKNRKCSPCMLPSGWAAFLYLYNLR